jgi:stage II sporulation protein D
VAGILFALLIASFSCGKRKAQIKTTSPPPSRPAAAKTAPAAKQPVPPKPVSPKESLPAAVGEPYKPTQAATIKLPEAPPGPAIRIGLVTGAKEIRVSCSGDCYLSGKEPEAAQRVLRGEIRVRVEEEVDEASAVFRIQVGSFANPQAAEDMAAEMRRQFAVPVRIRKNPAVGTYQVRIGEFFTKEEAQGFSGVLKDGGYSDSFIVQETVSTGGGNAVLALRGRQNLFQQSSSGFIFSPAAGAGPLSLNGKPYRGILDVVLNPGGQITVVNQLGMEEYLLGVVPAEISPEQYPEFAALAAQAIAARTYALKHMGRFRSEGFDLSADTRTQVYGGAGIETETTNKAVFETAGLAIYYENNLIDAMYMSTCGGRTEDFSNVFDAAPVPYLQSVFCAIEGGTENGGTVLEGKHEIDKVILSGDGSVANRNLEFARVLGLIESSSELSPDFLGGATERGEADRWIRNARRIAQKSGPGGLSPMVETITRAGFLQFAAVSFFGSDEIRRRISSSDVKYYMSNLLDGDAVPESARYALAYLMQRGLWHPNPDNTARPDSTMARVDALFLLSRWIESAKPEILRKGTFVSASPGKAGEAQDPILSIKWGNRVGEFPLSPQSCLFRLDPGRTTPVNSLKIIGNEKLAFHVNQYGVIDFLEIELNPTGASSDRYSPAATWDVTLTRTAVSEKLRTLSGDIGELRDLTPARIGNSGRVVQIQAVGSRKSVVLNGYQVRNALGLKDTLYTLTRERSPDGSVSAFRFQGRGSGHGIGLCQVGAFGMARAGRTYEEILKTYYQGVQIRKAY